MRVWNNGNLFFTITLSVFNVHFHSQKFLNKKLHLRDRKTMVCTLIYTVALDQSALEKLLSYCKNYI